MRFALRSESLTFFSLLVVASVVYSAYVVYRGVTGELGGMGTQHATVMTLMQGGSEIVALNVTVPNKGLYTLQVSVSCPQGTSSNIVCDPGSVTVPAGQQRVLHFQMTITDLAQYLASGNLRINGTVGTELVPFASLSVGVDLGSLANSGSG